MAKIENWIAFPEKVNIPIKHVNLYDAYGLAPPDLEMVDKKMRHRLGPYIVENPSEFSYEDYRNDFIIMFVSTSPKIREGWPREYALFRVALEIAAEESTGTWDPDLKTILPSEMDEESKQNMEALRGKVIGLNFQTGMMGIAFPKQGFEYGN